MQEQPGLRRLEPWAPESRSPSMRKHLRAVLGLTLVGWSLVFAGCVGDAEPTATPRATTSGSTAAGEATAEPDWGRPTTITPGGEAASDTPREGVATVGLRADGIPLAAEGTLIVYVKELRGSGVELVVFDLAAEERLSTFSLRVGRRFSIQLAGNRVLASFGVGLWSYALDGSDGRLIGGELSINYLLPSPDGRHVAVTGSDEDHPTGVALFEVRTGARVQYVDMQTVIPNWRGEPHPVRWLSNDAVLVGGLCNCDGSPEGFFDAELRFDGSVARLDEAPPEHGVEVLITDKYETACNLGGFNGGRSVQLTDTATGEVLAQARDDAPVFSYAELSPDAEEALVISIVADEELRVSLNDALDSGKCVEWREQSGVGAAPLQFGVLRTGATALEPVETRLEVLERWHDGLLPVIACGSEERAAADTSNWLNPAPWHDPAGFGAPWGFSSDDCQSGRSLLRMRVGNVAIDSQAAGYRVLGFLDPAGD